MNSLYLFAKSLCDPLFLFFIFSGATLFTLYRRKTLSPRSGAGLVLLLSFFPLYLLSLRPIAYGLNLSLETGCSPSSLDRSNIETVVVLGGGTTDGGHWGNGQPSLETANRLLLGLQVFEFSEARYLALSGGRPSKTGSGEAEVMAEIAKRLGVPADKLIIERESRNTHEHPARLSQFPQLSTGRIALVTSASHMRRAAMNFRGYFDDFILVPADCNTAKPGFSVGLLIPATRSLLLSSTVLYEFAGLIKDRLLIEVSGRDT